MYSFKIINAAFEVFTKNDIEKASTNSIVKQAEISRGLLYHYFENKQDLFEFLIYYSIKMITIGMEKNMDWEETDFLDRMRLAIILKFEVINKYPYMFDFFDKYAYRVRRLITKDQAQDSSVGLREKLYTHNIDFGLFKDGIDTKKMVNIVTYTLGGIAEEYWLKSKGGEEYLDLNMLIKECDEYITFFKKHFYR